MPLLGPSSDFNDICSSEFDKLEHMIVAELVGDIHAARERENISRIPFHNGLKPVRNRKLFNSLVL